jgi:hypothetical protein
MATETFKTLREVAIAIDGVKCVIEGVKSQLALMTLVFAGFAATSVTAFAYFFMVSVSNSTAIVRIETRLDGTMRDSMRSASDSMRSASDLRASTRDSIASIGASNRLSASSGLQSSKGSWTIVPRPTLAKKLDPSHFLTGNFISAH